MTANATTTAAVATPAVLAELDADYHRISGIKIRNTIYHLKMYCLEFRKVIFFTYLRNYNLLKVVFLHMLHIYNAMLMLNSEINQSHVVTDISR